jgi:hypothetical protein
MLLSASNHGDVAGETTWTSDGYSSDSLCVQNIACFEPISDDEAEAEAEAEALSQQSPAVNAQW